MRDLVANVVTEGCTILVSSHLLTEVRAIADRLVIIDCGRIVADDDVDTLLGGGTPTVHVRTPDLGRLSQVLTRLGAHVSLDSVSGLTVTGLTAAEVGYAAATLEIVLHELFTEEASLESIFMSLTTTPKRGRHTAAGRPATIQ